MNIIANNVASKLFVAFVAASMLFTLATPAKAATVEELQAMIAQLTAQIAALSGGSSAPAAGCTFTRALTVGSEGADVKCLQDYLTPTYFSNAGGSTGYFGPVTAAAVAAWQSANGVMPAAGYFGPVSQAKYNALMASAPTTPTTPGSNDSDDEDSGLGDGEGTLDNLDEVSSADANINEGEVGEVFAFTAEVEGDVEVNRVDMYLDSTAAGTESDNADDYFQGAMLLVDGEEVASLDVSDFDEDTSYAGDNDVVTGDTKAYRLRFSGLDLVFADGDEPEFTLALEANSSIDGADITETWGVDLAADSIRYVDGQGFTDSVGDTGIQETFGFDAEETAELDVSESSDNPDSATLEVDDTDLSEELEVLVVEVEEKNGVDATVEDMTFTITTTGTTDESVVVAEAILYADGDEIGSESVPTTGIVNFEDLGLDIDADETVSLSLALVFNGAEDYNEGDTVTAVFTSIDTASDANGNDEGDMTISGSADGNTHTLRSTGISVEVTSATTDITTDDGAAATNPDTATFTFKFTVTAFGNDTVYVNKDVADIVLAAGVAAGDVDSVYLIEKSAGADLASLSGTLTSSADTVTGDDTAYVGAYNGETFYKVSNEETFTLTITGTNATDSKQVRARLADIEWTTDLVTAATSKDAVAATINSYTDGLDQEENYSPFKSIN